MNTGSGLTDAEIIAWARANADAADEEGNSGAAARIRRLAEMAEQVAEQGWQPIATAPKDGTCVLLTDGHIAGASGWDYRVDVPNWLGMSFATPTHWRHLPALPSQRGEP